MDLYQNASVVISKDEHMASILLDANPWKLFIPKVPSIKIQLARIKVLLQHMRRAPNYRVLRPAINGNFWALYFIYSPDGLAYLQHLYTISKLHDMNLRILCVVASNAGDGYLLKQFAKADALIIKSLSGFDFSGYTIGLNHLVERLGLVNVLVMNDSVFGPFTDIYTFIDRSPWFLTGFTGSTAVEPHIQSYAFIFKQLDMHGINKLSSVLWRWFACNYHNAVAFLQETRLARIAASIGQVGTIWMPRNHNSDLTMAHPFTLVDSGFPFLKRSLLGKFSAAFDTEYVKELLKTLGHPYEGSYLFPGNPVII